METARLLAMSVGVVESLRPTLVPRTTKHQAMVTAACAATMGLAASPVAKRPVPGTRWLLPAGLVVAGVRAAHHIRAQRRSYPAWDPRPQNPAVAVGVGTVAGWTVAHAPGAIARWGRAAGDAVAARRGGSGAVWTGVLAGGSAVALTAAGTIGGKVALDALRGVGLRADPALADPPDSPYVTGGVGSEISYGTLARDGRRFVSFRTPADQIRSVDGRAMEPLRVYVGLESANTVEQRVDLAMRELDRLGAFERANLLIMSPAGSGYADYVAAEAIECFTRGDCASVVVQYGVLPSMLSLTRVALGAQTVRLLLDRIDERIAAQTRRPRVLMYGESLGARVAQEALRIAPSRVDDTGKVDGIDALVSVGTPGGPSLRNDLLHSPDVVHLDRWQQMTGDEKAHLWFVDHDADPVTRWDGALAWRYPDWLRRPRGRNVPDDMNWLPVLTWWQVIFDLVFAAQQQSGVFRSIGHDYRADLAPILAAVVGRGADVEKVADLLARREVMRDSTTSAITTGSIPPT
ncbi:MAG: alpha/beta-hydrolase family protein [Candidatus Nanopelagicales bacterium]